MPTKMLTDRAVQAAKTPVGRQQYDYRDQQILGLVLRVYKSGRKVWGVQYRRREDDKFFTFRHYRKVELSGKIGRLVGSSYKLVLHSCL